jgi:hypothetical protein
MKTVFERIEISRLKSKNSNYLTLYTSLGNLASDSILEADEPCNHLSFTNTVSPVFQYN